MDEINNNKAQRLSKLQKWILLRTYRKTIMAYTDGYVLFTTYGFRKVNYDANKSNVIFTVNTKLLRKGKGPSILTDLLQNVTK